ncbi:MAG: large subunit of alpha-aminoadipate reductase [Sclerophora amabilis]|nr:MAG: large subunit of alpha-aminoadipate reductase [Sclerophora amabilis]
MSLSGDENVEDEAYAADARGLMRQPPDFIRSAAADWDYAQTHPTVFLNGATAFWGSHILHELVDGPAKARYLVHVRAKDNAVDLDRLNGTMRVYGLWSPAWISTSRLKVEFGKLACIRLRAAGKPKRCSFVESTSILENEYYARLSQEIDTAVSEMDDLEGSRNGLSTGYG